MMPIRIPDREPPPSPRTGILFLFLSLASLSDAPARQKRGGLVFALAYPYLCGMEPELIRKRKMKRKLLLALLSVACLSCGWLGMSGLPLTVALVPLLILSGEYDASRRSFWKMFGWTALVTGTWSTLCTWWIWYAAEIGAILSVLIAIVLCGGPVMLYHYVSKRARPALAATLFVCGWIAAEYWYTTGEVSFPWLTLGNGFANSVRSGQWTEYTGVFGGSLWVLVCNLLFYRLWRVRTRRAAVQAFAALLLPMAFSFWLYHRAGSDCRGGEATVSVVQPNIDPWGEKFSLSARQTADTLLALANRSPAGVDYIVLPETAIDDRIWEENPEASPSLTRLAAFAADRRPGSTLVVGATTFRAYAPAERTATARPLRGGGWYDVYNSAILIEGDKRGIHHKSKLVVGVEKMPYPRLMKALDFLIIDLGGTTGQMGTDPYRKVFRSDRGITSAVAICYESVYGAYVSEFAARGAQLLLVVTNDGWWHDTPGYRQHFSFARLRAIETRRSIARSANTGISGFIDPRGEVGSTLGWDERGTLTAALPLNVRITCYTRYGDFTARIALLVFLLGMLYYMAYRIRRKNHLVP